MPRNALIQLRRDTAANWTSTNPTLASGEMGLETDTGKFKIGALRTYAIGDVGPGGGKVFITPSTAGNSTGKYFEVAPVGVEVTRTWATGGNQSIAVSGADGTLIGAGAQNTIDIVAQAGNVAATSAAVYCSDLVSGGYSDWFLPSKDELNQMYVNRVALNTSFLPGTYWSSSEYVGNGAWFQYSSNGTQDAGNKNGTRYVRPVRAFTVGMEWEYILYATDASDITGTVIAGTTSTATSGIGYMGLPQNSTTTGNYPIVAADAGKHIYSTANRIITIPGNTTGTSPVAFPVGATIVFINATGTVLTLSMNTTTTDTCLLAGVGTSMTGGSGSRTLAAHGMATCVKITSTSWIISGTGLT